MRAEADQDCDVLVVGGGPAGAATAARLARYGYSVILADRQRFPRDKVCGDFVGPAAIAELVGLGLDRRAEFRGGNLIHRAALFLDGRPLIEQMMPRAPMLPDHGRVIPRLVLDHWIHEAALEHGARPLEGHRLTGFAVDEGGVTAELSGRTRRVRARALVGADGSASLVARRLNGGKPGRLDRIVAVRAYYEGVEGPDDRCDLFFSGPSFPGYYWLFPTGGGGANVGLGMVLETLPPTEARLADLLDDLVRTDPALAERLSGARRVGGIVGWPLMTYNPRRAVTGDRVLLVGDAAGLINPLNGEGIQYALESAGWAAEALARALATDRLGAAGLAPYAARVREAMDYDMALANLIVMVIRNRTLNPVWLLALRIICARARRDPAYAEIAGGILAGLTPAKRALSARMLLGTVEQAALSLGMGAAAGALRADRGPGGFALGLLRQAAGMAGGSAAEPLRLLRWTSGVGTMGGRLAVQAGADLAARGLGRGRAPGA